MRQGLLGLRQLGLQFAREPPDAQHGERGHQQDRPHPVDEQCYPHRGGRPIDCGLVIAQHHRAHDHAETVPVREPDLIGVVVLAQPGHHFTHALQPSQPILVGGSVAHLDQSLGRYVDDRGKAHAIGMILGERERRCELGIAARSQPDIEARFDRLSQITRHDRDAGDVQLLVGLAVVVVVEEADEADGERDDQRYRQPESQPQRRAPGA